MEKKEGKDRSKLSLFVQCFIMSDSSLRRSGMARVNGGSHTVYLPLTRLHTSGMSHTCLYFPAIEHHHTLASCCCHVHPLWAAVVGYNIATT